MRKVNEITSTELEQQYRNDENAPASTESLPCGAWVTRYWQDENGEQYAACAAGHEFQRRGATVTTWHFVHVAWEQPRQTRCECCDQPMDPRPDGKVNLCTDCLATLNERLGPFLRGEQTADEALDAAEARVQAKRGGKAGKR